MNAYLIGNLLGRLLASYAIAWILLWLFSRFDWRQALRRSYRWYGLLLLTVIFILGILRSIQQGSIT